MLIEMVNYPPPQSYMNPASDRTDIVVHHSAGSPFQSPLDIDAEERHTPPPNGPYAMMPYCYLIGHDGTIYSGRPMKYEEAASYGRHAQSLSICVIGQFQEDAPNYAPPTSQQIASLKNFLVWAHKQYPKIERTIAHGDIAPMFYPHDEGDYSTACCGSTLRAMLPELRAYVHQQLGK